MKRWLHCLHFLFRCIAIKLYTILTLSFPSLLCVLKFIGEGGRRRRLGDKGIQRLQEEVEVIVNRIKSSYTPDSAKKKQRWNSMTIEQLKEYAISGVHPYDTPLMKLLYFRGIRKIPIPLFIKLIRSLGIKTSYHGRISFSSDGVLEIAVRERHCAFVVHQMEETGAGFLPDRDPLSFEPELSRLENLRMLQQRLLWGVDENSPTTLANKKFSKRVQRCATEEDFEEINCKFVPAAPQSASYGPDP